MIEGGKCYLDNLQVLCATCNTRKSGYTLDPSSYDLGYVRLIDVQSIYRINNSIMDVVERENT